MVVCKVNNATTTLILDINEDASNEVFGGAFNTTDQTVKVITIFYPFGGALGFADNLVHNYGAMARVSGSGPPAATVNYAAMFGFDLGMALNVA
jgi:hypothetical protein